MIGIGRPAASGNETESGLPFNGCSKAGAPQVGFLIKKTQQYHHSACSSLSFNGGRFDVAVSGLLGASLVGKGPELAKDSVKRKQHSIKL